MISVIEFQRCKNDVVYFINKYVKMNNLEIILENNSIPSKLYNYQEEIINLYCNNKFVISKWYHGSGKTITFIEYLLHYIIFNRDKIVGIKGHNIRSEEYILNELIFLYNQLPEFFKDGIKKVDKKSILLNNGCKVIIKIDNLERTIEEMSLFILDEFAYMKNTDDIIKLFYKEHFFKMAPRIFIISVPYVSYHNDTKKINCFYKMWMDTINKEIPFVSHSCTWKDNPTMDDDFKIVMTQYIGEESFKTEYGCTFLE